MDPISTTAISTVLSGLLKPATDEAGARMLVALRAIAQRIPGLESRGELAQLKPGGSVDPPVLAGELVAAATGDPDLTRDLTTWLQEAYAVIDTGSISNMNSGSVKGPLIQGRDFSGPITFE